MLAISPPRAFPRSRIALFSAIAIVGCAADLLSKYSVFRWLGEFPETEPNAPYWLWEGYVGLQTTVNHGALFGMGEGYGPLFVVLSMLAVVGILFWLFYRGAARDRFLTVALGCVLGGVLGNLYDRLGLWEAVVAENQFGVRDWILLEYQGHPWPNFNLADCLLVCGAALLAWHAFWHREEPHDGAESHPADAAN